MATDTSLLELENERLQTLLLHYQEEASGVVKVDKGVVVISKPVFFVLVMGIVFMVALLSYFLLFRTPEAKLSPGNYKENVVTPDTTGRETEKKGYSWDNEKDSSLTDTVATQPAPVQLKPTPPLERDTTVMDLDTTVHF